MKNRELIKIIDEIKVMQQPQQYFINDDGIFPNSILPVLYYPNALQLPLLFSAMHVKNIFEKNDWGNTWRSGIYTYHHYHSITHEAMAIIKGKTILQLGGDNGIELTVQKEMCWCSRRELRTKISGMKKT
jgi:uncharacterized protein YjlB